MKLNLKSDKENLCQTSLFNIIYHRDTEGGESDS